MITLLDTQQAIFQHIAEHQGLIAKVYELLGTEIASFSKTMSDALLNGSTVFWCGNGGSAADSQHLAAELVGRFKKDRRPLRSVALTTDTSVLTCVANDYSYEDIFARQVEALSRPGDVLVGISTSGQSENILRAVKMARSLGLQTLGLLGKDGGVAKDLVDQAIVIPSESTARIQEAHILIGHILCDLIEQELGLA
jgi:D-sedoheptulose 7-phosphate isomerase